MSEQSVRATARRPVLASSSTPAVGEPLPDAARGDPAFPATTTSTGPSTWTPYNPLRRSS